MGYALCNLLQGVLCSTFPRCHVSDSLKKCCVQCVSKCGKRYRTGTYRRSRMGPCLGRGPHRSDTGTTPAGVVRCGYTGATPAGAVSV
jgi:hypothetical protein